MPDEVVRLRLDAWRNLGRLHRITGHFDAAERLFRQALGLAEDFFGPASDETAWVGNDLGMVGKFAGHFRAAAQWYAHARTILTANHGADDGALASLSQSGRVGARPRRFRHRRTPGPPGRRHPDAHPGAGAS